MKRRTHKVTHFLSTNFLCARPSVHPFCIPSLLLFALSDTNRVIITFTDNSEDQSGDSGDYEFDLPGADYDAAESEEAALQYLMANNSTAEEAVEAYYMLQQLQAQGLPDMSFTQGEEDDEDEEGAEEESESVEGGYFEGLEGSEDASSAEEEA